VDAVLALRDEASSVVVAPIGFVSDHMEVVYDLDVVVRAAADEAGLELVRAATPGTHPRFVQMIVELLREQLDPDGPVLALGARGAWPTPCRDGCCPPPVRGPGAARAAR
jgi:ferrochelatase